MKNFFILRNRYIPALLLIILFSILGFINMNEIISSFTNEGKIINISGKQRMLSQKLLLLASNFIKEPSDEIKNRLLKNIDLIKTNHEYLLKNSTSEVITKLYKEGGLDEDLKKYIYKLNLLINSKDINLLYELNLFSEELLQKLDNAGKTYEYGYKTKLNLLQIKGIFIFISILVIIIFEWIFIFEPASNKIEKNTKSLKTAIKEKTKELQKSIDIISENVIYSRTDLNGTIIYASKAFCEISGYTKEKLLGRYHNIVKHSDMSQEVFKDMWKTIQAGKQWKGEVKNSKKNGGFYWVEAFISPERDKNNKIIGYNAVQHDITLKKELEELNKNLEKRIALEVEKNREKDKCLLEQRKMTSLGEMIENIAHQWRQPLSIISMSITNLQIQKKINILSDEDFTTNCNKINENVQYLSQTIDSFRNFLHGKSKKETFNLKKSIDSFISLVSTSIKTYEIEVDLNIPNDIVINSLKNELSQCFFNLFNNSKDAFIKNKIINKNILISANITNNELTITFRDNAGGIPDNIIDKIFEPYFTTKHQFIGTGLGLNIVYKFITERMNGNIQVRNINFNNKNDFYDGAEFIITLPLKKLV